MKSSGKGTKAGCCSARKKICLLFVSAVVVLVLGAVSFSFTNKWLQSIIDAQLVLKRNSPLYEQWKATTIPVYIQFYMFTVENPMEVKQGVYPFVSQKGPYSYRVYQTKKNITWNRNGTVSYNKFSKYEFDAGSSCSQCDPHVDNITLPNIPLVILSQASKMFPGSSFIFSIIFEQFKETFFKETSVHKLLWGYKDPVFELFAKLRSKYHLTFLPQIDPVFRMMRNNTLDGIVTVYTGAEDIRRTGVWKDWNGKPDVGLWNSSWANMLNGSDGMQFPPQTNSEDVLYAFFVQLCRSMRFVYDSQKTIHGVETLRFTYPKDLWENASVNPGNAGFCPNGCFPTGILDASVCKKTPVSIPVIVASEPHFYQGDPMLVKKVGGLNPIKEEHGTFFDIEPHFGLPLHLKIQIQLNVYIKSVDLIPQTQGVKDVILPIMYFNNSVTIDKSTANKMKEILTLMKIAPWVSMSLILIGAAALVVACFCIGKVIKQKKREKKGSDAANERTRLISSMPQETDLE